MTLAGRPRRSVDTRTDSQQRSDLRTYSRSAQSSIDGGSNFGMRPVRCICSAARSPSTAAGQSVWSISSTRRSVAIKRTLRRPSRAEKSSVYFCGFQSAPASLCSRQTPSPAARARAPGASKSSADCGQSRTKVRRRRRPRRGPSTRMLESSVSGVGPTVTASGSNNRNDDPDRGH